MKTSIACFVIFYSLLCSTTIFAGNLDITNQPTGLKSTTNYLSVTAQINRLLAQAASCSNSESALAVIALEADNTDSQLLSSKRSDWEQVRFQTAFAVLTNLSLLENAIKTTEIVNSMPIKPPDIYVRTGNQVWSMSPIPENVVTNTVDKERLMAYKTALQASGKLGNLRQILVDEQNRYADKALNFIVNAYSRQPIKTNEIQNLITAFPNTDCALQFSNRLKQIKK